MIEVMVPGWGDYSFKHLVLDVNGTIAIDGQLIDGVLKRISQLRGKLEVHLLTANTFGQQDKIDHYLNLKSIRLTKGNEAHQKAEYVRVLGKEHVASIGQGANDAEMLRTAQLGICVLSAEGTAKAAIDACDLLCPDILSALDLFENPLRMIASLRR